MTQAQAGNGQLSPGWEKSKPFSLQGSQPGALELQGSVGWWRSGRLEQFSLDRGAGGCGRTQGWRL